MKRIQNSIEFLYSHFFIFFFHIICKYPERKSRLINDDDLKFDIEIAVLTETNAYCLPDIQNAICEKFQSAECSVEASPELTEPPFNFAFHALGKKIHLLPSGSMIPEDFDQISVISVRFSYLKIIYYLIEKLFSMKFWRKIDHMSRTNHTYAMHQKDVIFLVRTKISLLHDLRQYLSEIANKNKQFNQSIINIIFHDILALKNATCRLELINYLGLYYEIKNCE